MRIGSGWVALAVVVAAWLLGGCVKPRRPPPPRPPAPDRYQLVASPDPLARGAAADELSIDPSPSAAEMLVMMIQRDGDPAVRARAAAAIERRHDTGFDQVLLYAARFDPDPQVRAAAAAAHRRLEPWRKTPGGAAVRSLLCPGCGQMYLGNRGEGAAYLATTAAMLGGGLALADAEDIQLGGPVESPRTPIALGLLTAAQNTWSYAIFDAYRDARVARGDEGYRHEITRESLVDLATAPVRPGVLKSPWVWLGVPLALAAGIGASYLVEPEGFTETRSIFEVDDVNVFGRRFSRGPGFALGSGYFAALFTPVGIGEEALFRGVIQTELEERLGPTGGLVAASTIFGAVHVFNFLDEPKDALFAVPFITLVGSSLGLAYQHTGHKLSTSVAMHFWYDTLLSMAAFAADPEHQPFVVNYAMPL